MNEEILVRLNQTNHGAQSQVRGYIQYDARDKTFREENEKFTCFTCLASLQRCQDFSLVGIDFPSR